MLERTPAGKLHRSVEKFPLGLEKKQQISFHRCEYFYYWSAVVDRLVDFFIYKNILFLFVSCLLLRYASQNSLDESSQKHVPRENGKDKPPYRNHHHTNRAFDVMNTMRKCVCDRLSILLLCCIDFEVLDKA